MTKELTISHYDNQTKWGYELMISLFFFLIFSGLTMLGIWIFKFADQTSETKTETKKDDKYFDELGIPGLVITYIFIGALIIAIYHHHLKSSDTVIG